MGIIDFKKVKFVIGIHHSETVVFATDRRILDAVGNLLLPTNRVSRGVTERKFVATS
jgi:hypothetical protein